MPRASAFQAWSVKDGFRDALMLAERWKTAILVDQADVFLEERTVADLSRNSIVAGESMLYAPTSSFSS
jgi:hypothetical protein